MNQLDWLIGHSVTSILHREYDWLLAFDRHALIVIGCLWRLLEDGRICLTSNDNSQQFGLPAPVDAAQEANNRLFGMTVESVELREETLDLRLTFNSGQILEVLPDSAGYEAWDVSNETERFIAVGGGDLSVLRQLRPK
jgi:hypothetical protein